MQETDQLFGDIVGSIRAFMGKLLEHRHARDDLRAIEAPRRKVDIGSAVWVVYTISLMEGLLR